MSQSSFQRVGAKRSLPVAGFLVLALVAVLAATDALAAKPACPDGKCNGGETPASCPLDCAAPPPDDCGDGICGATETTTSCPADCPPPPPATCNNDGVCNAGEDCTGCADCPGRTGGNPRNRFCCGADSFCDTGVCGANCGDAVPVCGNGTLEYSEECDGGPGGSETCDLFCRVVVPAVNVPLNQFNIGDSIGEGQAANGTIGSINHQTVWSTGYSTSDSVISLNERFETLDAAGYSENNSSRDGAINQALSGAVMADFAGQAADIAAQMSTVPPGTAGMVTILLGNNDVCAPNMDSMTNPATFEAQYRAGLDILSEAPFSDNLNLQISSIPAIYWLWDAKWTDFICRAVIWPFVPCQNLLSGADDDCASATSRQDPDRVYAGDGPNCQRRKAFHARIRDVYNPILSGVLAEYQDDGKLPNAEYVDILDVRFGSSHVNGGDCFHPSTAGHALMAEKQWCRSKWGADDPACSP